MSVQLNYTAKRRILSPAGIAVAAHQPSAPATLFTLCVIIVKKMQRANPSCAATFLNSTRTVERSWQKIAKIKVV